MSNLINGLKVDHQAIADGLYHIICDLGQDHIVAFGMIPKEIMDMAERLIREKVVAEAAKQMGCTVEEFTPYVDAKLLDDTVREIVKRVATGIYTAAGAAGRMIV